MPWQALLLSRFKRGVWTRGCFKNEAHFLVTNPFLISFGWCKAIYCWKCDWHYIYQSLQGLANSSLPWRNSSRNVWEGCSLSHHPCTCGTTGKWGLKGCVTLAWFQDPDPCNICRAGRREPSVLLRAEPRSHSAYPSPQLGVWQQLGSIKAFHPSVRAASSWKKSCLHRSCPNSCLGHREWWKARSSPDVWNGDPWCERRNIHIRRQLILSPLKYQGGSWAAIGRRGCCLLNTHLHTQTHTICTTRTWWALSLPAWTWLKI